MAAAVGVLVGRSVRARVPAAPSAVAVAAEVRPAPLPSAPCSSTELSPELVALVAAEERAAALQREVEALIGPPRAFPDDLDPRWSPENAADTVHEALAGTGFAVEDVRCEDWPCVAIVSHPMVDGFATDPLFDHLGLDRSLPIHVMGRSDHWSMTIPLMPPPDPDDTLWLRQVNHRLDVTGEDTLLEEVP